MGLGILAGMLAGLAALLLIDPGSIAGASSGGGSGTFIVFLLLGGVLGILAAYALLGVRWVRGGLLTILGAYVGALAGLIVYVAGFIAANRTGAANAADAATLAAGAILAVNPWEVLAVGLGAALGVVVVRYSWRFEGLLAFVALGMVVLGYISYTLFVTLPQVPPTAMPLSLILFVAEAFALSFVLVYAFYPLDVVQRKRWPRHEDQRRHSRHYEPKVVFQVPLYNEPPDMVIETLEHLQAVDYAPQRRLIMVVDDSTDDACSAPVRQYCQQHGLTYLHRTDRRGYKAGALNHALAQTPADVEIIAVIDADYQVDPAFLRDTVGYFVDSNVAFVQTPQSYRNADSSFLTRQYEYADAYFYHTVLPSRNEGNAIIFCGTMGLLSRRVLHKVGGWSEDHVTEDAELAVRILDAGYETVYVSRSYGKGLIPETFSAYRKQHNRWAFGGGQVLRTHLFRILNSRRLTRRQKFDFVAGSIHWFDGIFLITISLVLAALALGDLAGAAIVTHHQAEIWLVGLIPLLLLAEAILRVRLSLNRIYDLSVWQVLKVFGMWFSVKFSNLRAALRGLAGETRPFARTPKDQQTRLSRTAALGRAVSLTRFETAMALIMLPTAVAFGLRTLEPVAATGAPDLTRTFLLTWLCIHGMLFLCGPLYAYRSYRDLPRAEKDRDEAAPAGLPPPPRDGAPWARGPTRTAIVLGIAALALVLRLKDPLSTPIIGAEDPYLHMERTWDLIQGRGLPENYPPGFAFLLAPFAWLGPGALYWVARLGPPILGVVEVLGIYLLLREHVRETGAMTGALAAAVMPENIIRTNQLFPTALDLAILPFFFLFAIRAAAGDRLSMRRVVLISAALLVLHTWVVALVLPSVALYMILQAPGRRRAHLLAGSATAAVAVLLTLTFLPGAWNPFPSLLANVGNVLSQLAREPNVFANPPLHVNLPHMLTPAVLVAATGGAAYAIFRRKRLDQFALLYTLPLLPLVLVDWFDLWFLPHRIVGYVTLGAAMLTGIATDGLLERIPGPAATRWGAVAAASLVFVAATAPAAASAPTWYRLYDGDDYLVWTDVAATDPALVITGSWQGRVGYRGLTGEQAEYVPPFFHDANTRQSLVERYGNVVVLVDPYLAENGHGTAFLDSEGWVLIAERGQTRAYRPG